MKNLTNSFIEFVSKFCKKPILFQILQPSKIYFFIFFFIRIYQTNHTNENKNLLILL